MNAVSLIPSLDEIRQDPTRIERLSGEVCYALITELQARSIHDAALVARLAHRAALAPADRRRTADDRLMEAKEVADRLQVTPAWVYEHAAELPFTVRLGDGTRSVRFSSLGFDEWIRRQSNGDDTLGSSLAAPRGRRARGNGPRGRPAQPPARVGPSETTRGDD
jgi:predicted DNA-binding transcriptional regulator AlpA